MKLNAGIPAPAKNAGMNASAPSTGKTVQQPAELVAPVAPEVHDAGDVEQHVHRREDVHQNRRGQQEPGVGVVLEAQPHGYADGDCQLRDEGQYR
jgi:hypothetical protein